MEQALSFEGTGLDLDNNYATVNPGDSPFRLNCRYGSTDRSDLGGIQNFKGDTLITKAFGKDAIFEQPPGENEVIGSCKDLERDAIIYFVWNEFGRHQIRRYYTQTNEIQVILESPILNFKRNYKIFHANVVDKYLSWTDGYMNPEDEWDYNPPRQIDMELAYGYMLGLPWPQGYQTIDEQTLDAICYAPQLCPTFQYENDLNFNDNRLYGHLFQFGYRYVYYDNSRSVISPLSKLTLPQGEDIEGNYELQIENMLRVTVETGHYTVKTIELIAREGASWKVVDTIDKYNESGQTLFGPTYTFQFYNTKFIAEIPLEEALRPFDYVPQVASAQEVISSQGGARRVYGGYVEGYKNVENIKLNAEVKIEKINPENINYKNISFKRKGAYQLGVIYSDKAGRKSFVQTNPNLKLTIPWWRQTDLVDAYYDANDEWILSSHQKPYIEWNLEGQAPSWATSYQIVCTKNLTSNRSLVFYNFGGGLGDDDYKCYNEGNTTLSIPPDAGYDFIEGDRIRIIAQFDNSIYPYLERNFFTTFLPDSGPPITKVHRVLGGIQALNTIHPFQYSYWVNCWQTYNDVSGKVWDLKIKKFDPQTQRIFFEGGFDLNLSHFYLFEIYNPSQEPGEENQTYFEVGESYKIINGQHSVNLGRIEGIDTFVRNTKTEFKPIPYNFKISSASARPANANNGIPDFFYIKNAISLYSHAGVFSGNPGFLPFQNGAYVFNSGPCGSIPISPDNPEPVFDASFSVSGTLKVAPQIEDIPNLDGNYNAYFVNVSSDGATNIVSAIFKFPTLLQELFQSSQQEFLSIGGDAVLTFNSPRRSINISNIIWESTSYSQYYQSKATQTGRPYIINKEAVRRKYFANLIWGGQFFDNTLLNFFSKYESDSVLKLNERYNEITKIQEVGFMLKVRQRNKSTSIYIGRTELTNADGSSNLAASNNVLGTINVSDEIWGGTNGTADCRSIRDTYFFDYINGTVVRDATNGLIAISGNLASQQDPYRMTAFFRDLSDWFKANESSAEVVSTWDNHTQSVIFTIRRLGGGDNPRPIPDFVAKYKLEEAWNEGLTLSFHEPTNRWQTFHSYVREWYEAIGNTLVSFNKGDLYLHYSNDNRTEYMGVRYPIITAQICNQYTNNVKVFDNIDVYSNKKWRAEGSPILDDIYILPNAQFPNGMRSKLSYNNFIGKEGKWHSTFLCDINSPGFNNTLLALMNGRRLRGEAMKVALRNEDIDEVFLRQVIFHFTPSELSGGG